VRRGEVEKLLKMESLSALLVAEIEAHWARKSSLEGRALSLAGSNFAVITIFIGVWPHGGLIEIFRSGSGVALAAVAVTMSMISIGSSLAAAVPRRIGGLDPGMVRTVLARIESGSIDSVEVKADILQIQRGEIESLQSKLQVAGTLTLISAVAFIVMFLLLSGLFVASWFGNFEV
jgi:hypothetical protein